MSLLPTAEQAPVVGGAWHHKAVYMTQHLQQQLLFPDVRNSPLFFKALLWWKTGCYTERPDWIHISLITPKPKQVSQTNVSQVWMALVLKNCKVYDPQVAAFALPVYAAICDRESDPLVLALFYWEKISLFCAYALCFVSVCLYVRRKNGKIK